MPPMHRLYASLHCNGIFMFIFDYYYLLANRNQFVVSVGWDGFLPIHRFIHSTISSQIIVALKAPGNLKYDRSHIKEYILCIHRKLVHASQSICAVVFELLGRASVMFVDTALMPAHPFRRVLWMQKGSKTCVKPMHLSPFQLTTQISGGHVE